MKKRRNRTYVALEDANLVWNLDEVLMFRRLWNAGLSFVEIAKQLGRHQIEVAALLMDQADKGKVKVRETGLGI